MNEPYEDAPNFPPEWEENESPLENMMALPLLMALADPRMVDEVMNKYRAEFKNVLSKFAVVASFAGLASCEIVCNRKQEGNTQQDHFEGGFHGALHMNIAKYQLDDIGVSQDDVQQVWDIYTGHINNYFESLKNESIRGGFSDSGS